MTPEFSILHATIRLPDGWRAAYQAWKDACDHWSRVEYILAIDAEYADNLLMAPEIPDDVKLVVNYGRHCSVDAFNAAAEASTGDFLIQSADDWFPCPHWDTEIRKLVPDMSKEAVIDVDNGHFTGHIIICPMLTRAYYERPGRGACGGKLFYPEYMSMGADDDFTLVAKRDGVVITAYHLFFDHQHPWRGNVDHDTHGAYAHNQSHAAWHVKDTVLPRRIAEDFQR